MEATLERLEAKVKELQRVSEEVAGLALRAEVEVALRANSTPGVALDRRPLEEVQERMRKVDRKLTAIHGGTVFSQPGDELATLEKALNAVGRLAYPVTEDV